MSRTVAGLLERGLLSSAADPADRRRMRLALTRKGEKVMKELAPVARDVRAAVVEGMDEAELAALRRGLRHILANLDRYEARVRRRPS
jgi:DNA-binding MarR family transcriptional regulator